VRSALAQVLVLLLAACGSSTEPAGTPTMSGPVAVGAASAPAASVSPAAVDPALLAILPDMIEGLARQRDPALDADLARDPAIAASAESFATAIWIDVESGAFAYASVVRPKPGVFGAEFFRSWRDSFDEGACSQADGIAGNAEAEIAGHRTFIGSCVGGLRTYHTYVESRGVLVSISAPDQRRFGERVIEGLAP